jgi:hypothetical protein
MPRLPLAELLKLTKFLKTPIHLPKMGFSRPFPEWGKLKNRVLYGQGPKIAFEGTNPVKNPEQLKNANEFSKLNEYIEKGKKKAVEFAHEVAVETAKDYLKEAIVALIALTTYLATCESDSEAQLKLLEKEREELIKEVKSKEAEKEDLEAALKEIEKQYVTWMDWWNDSTGKKKTEIKTEIAKLSSQLSRVEGNLKNKSDAIKELKDFMEELQKSRDVALMLD